MLDTIGSWGVVVMCAWCLYWKWRMWRLTRTRAVFVIMLAFVSTMAVRICVLIHQPFVCEHSKALTAVTFFLFSWGICWLVLVLSQAYRIRSETYRIRSETAARLAKAEQAALQSRKHAIISAEAAERARLHAVNAAKLVDIAARDSLTATRLSGEASEASRAAEAEAEGK